MPGPCPDWLKVRMRDGAMKYMETDKYGNEIGMEWNEITTGMMAKGVQDAGTYGWYEKENFYKTFHYPGSASD